MALLHSVLIAKVRHPEEGAAEYVTLAQSNGSSGQGTVGGSVVEAYHQFMGNTKEGIAGRKQYSQCVLIVDNTMRANHDFPDVDRASQEKARKNEIRATADLKKQAAARRKKLAKQLAETEAELDEASTRLSKLTGAPLEAVSPEPTPEPTPEPSVEEVAEVAEVAEVTEDADAVELIAAKFEAGEPVTAEELDSSLTVPQLKTLAERYDIEIAGDAKKSDIVKAILLPD